MTHIPEPTPKISSARCANLSANNHFVLPLDQYECVICPFRVPGSRGIHVIANVTVVHPQNCESENIEVVCQQIRVMDWYRRLYYRRNGGNAHVDVILYTDGTGRTMTPGMYQVAFRLEHPDPGVRIMVRGRVIHR